MKAGLLLRERHQIGDDCFVELKVWRVPRPVRSSAHGYKYSLAYIVRGVCVVRTTMRLARVIIGMSASGRRLTTSRRSIAC